MKNKKDVYTKVSERIIEGLKTKGLKWFRPWEGGGCSPINNTTGKAYRGYNHFILSITTSQMGYAHNEWITYKQAQAKGGTVRKGQKGTEIVFWNITFVDKDGNFYRTKDAVMSAGLTLADVKKVFSPRLWSVFNIDQCDDIAPRRTPVKGGKFSPIEEAEKVYNEKYDAEKKPTLGHGGESAFYAPSRHHVQMPLQERFVSSDDYYKTLFHELVHSTGHESMLKRLDKVSAFGSEDYSKEELVAEIGSEFLVGITGINPKDNANNSQAYINGWIKKLEDKPKMALSACNQAMKAVDLIIGEE